AAAAEADKLAAANGLIFLFKAANEATKAACPAALSAAARVEGESFESHIAVILGKIRFGILACRSFRRAVRESNAAVEWVEKLMRAFVAASADPAAAAAAAAASSAASAAAFAGSKTAAASESRRAITAGQATGFFSTELNSGEEDMDGEEDGDSIRGMDVILFNYFSPESVLGRVRSGAAEAREDVVRMLRALAGELREQGLAVHDIFRSLHQPGTTLRATLLRLMMGAVAAGGVGAAAGITRVAGATVVARRGGRARLVATVAAAAAAAAASEAAAVAEVVAAAATAAEAAVSAAPAAAAAAAGGDEAAAAHVAAATGEGRTAGHGVKREILAPQRVESTHEDEGPEELAPGEVAPGEVAPGEVAPGEVAPGEVAPGEMAPGEVAPREAAPNDSIARVAVFGQLKRLVLLCCSGLEEEEWLQLLAVCVRLEELTGPPLPPTNGTAPDGSAASGADAAPDDAGIKMVLPNISFSMGQPTIGATGAPPGGGPPSGPPPHGGPTPALPPYPPPSNEGYPPSGGGYPPDSAPRSTGLGALGIGGDGGDMRGDTRGEHGEHRQKRSAGEMYGGEPGDSARGGERGERGERGGGPGGERGGGSGEQKRWPGWPGDNVFRFVVPMGKVGSIIGRRGEYVKKICDETKARVKIVEGAPGTDDRVVLVSGREDPDLELPPAVVAMMRVHRRIVEGVSEDEIEASQPGEGFRGQVATRLLVPATQAGSLIGRQGQTIKALQDSTGAHIRILSLEDVPPCALEDDRVVEVTGEYASVHEAVKGVTLHLRRFLCDHSVLPLFEQCRSFPPPMDPRGAPYSSPSGRGGGWGNPPPGGMHSPPHRSRFDLPPSAAPDPYGSLSSLGSMGGPDRYGTAMGGMGAGGGGMDASGQLRAALSKYGRETPAAAAAAAMTNTVSPVVTQVSATMQIPLSYVDAIIGPNGTNIVFLRRTSGGVGPSRLSSPTSPTCILTLCYAGQRNHADPSLLRRRHHRSQRHQHCLPACAAPAGVLPDSYTTTFHPPFFSIPPTPSCISPIFVLSRSVPPCRSLCHTSTPSSAPTAPTSSSCAAPAGVLAHPDTRTHTPLPPHPPLQVSATMQIPLSYVDAIIGPNGTNIVFLRRTSGAAVTIQESRGAGGQPEMTVEVRGSATQPEMTVEVRGSATQVQTAQQLIEAMPNLRLRLHHQLRRTGLLQRQLRRMARHRQTCPAMARLFTLPALLGVVLGPGEDMDPQEGTGIDWVDPTPSHQCSEVLQVSARLLYPSSSAGGGAGAEGAYGFKFRSCVNPCDPPQEPLSALASEYAAGSSTFQDKIEHLAAEYEAIRRTRGDGNCFFRCFLFALLEHLLQGGSKEECEQVRERVARSEQRLRDLGYTEFTWEDFAAEYRELLDAVDPSTAAEKIKVDGLLKRCQDPDCSNYAVMFLRFITSADIQHRADFFHPFLPDAMAGMGTPKEAAKQWSPWGEESDHAHITAGLSVPILVTYLIAPACFSSYAFFVPSPVLSQGSGGNGGGERSRAHHSHHRCPRRTHPDRLP
ncbi:unnamed protein product, partial [Closterium sp. Naga37s-1]